MIVPMSTIYAQVPEDTIEVGSGWNIIGSLYDGAALDILRSDPPGIIVSAFFAYNPSGGYQSMDTLKKGIGYWVKVVEDGILIFIEPDENFPPNQPYDPSPADYSTDVDTNITISWSCADPEDDPLTYDVYFGTDTPPATKVSSDQTETSIVRNDLAKGPTYFWRVVAKDDHSNSRSSPVWRFTTTWTCGNTINYADKTYNTVLIGSQCWLRENLDIGIRINGSSNQSDNSTIEKYCYNDDSANCSIYGGLYLWNEAMQYTTTPGAIGICPPDWHIPTLAEFQILSTTVGGDANALKAVGQGTGAGAGTNTSGFTALFPGTRGPGGVFVSLNYYAAFWGSTEGGPTYDDDMALFYDDNLIRLYYGDNVGYAFSVRCLKN